MSVKNSKLKNLAKELCKRFEWTDSWEENKKLLKQRTTITSKKLLNQLAGIITREISKREYERRGVDKNPTIFRITCSECGYEMIYNSKARGITIRCPVCNAIIYRGGLKFAYIVEDIK